MIVAARFAFHAAAPCHQFHDGVGEHYDETYKSLKDNMRMRFLVKDTGCPASNCI
jgi:hypothetical protein